MAGMTDNALNSIEAHIREQVAAYCGANHVPGFVAGVYQAGEQVVVAHGTANLTTGAPMLPDTGFLFGSVTKVLTTTLVLQQVERGVLDLDAPVVRYLPEFTLGDTILVRHLVTHTNGIDADLFFPDERGRDALRAYVDGLAGNCGTLFEPGEQLSDIPADTPVPALSPAARTWLNRFANAPEETEDDEDEDDDEDTYESLWTEFLESDESDEVHQWTLTRMATLRPAVATLVEEIDGQAPEQVAAVREAWTS
ncbi:serine hydrolase domain-containing protein [Kibdelosporangium lantanae]|uniref:Serine hydrolase domain-containing protein n=1 Tax=Kibdelosporangium lantanae TaxID=1497396 RepID=A0ABW3M452_9PSEU